MSYSGCLDQCTLQPTETGDVLHVNKTRSPLERRSQLAGQGRRKIYNRSGIHFSQMTITPVFPPVSLIGEEVVVSFVLMLMFHNHCMRLFWPRL